MRVICIEGCHGSGKSTLCRELASLLGADLIDEGFLDMPQFKIGPQTLVMETVWISNWFQRVLEAQKRHEDSFPEGNAPEKILVADRSIFSAVYYAGEHGHLLDPLIRNALDDLKQVGILVVTVCLNVREDLLWLRIQQRLKREPERKQYKEDSKEWMQVTNKWYLDRDWDFTVDNDTPIIKDVAAGLASELQPLLSTKILFPRIAGECFLPPERTPVMV